MFLEVRLHQDAYDVTDVHIIIFNVYFYR